MGIDSIRVGSVRAYDLTACVVDLGQMGMLGFDVHGLLGLNFLKSFRMVLDFERDVLTLEPPRARPPAGDDGPPGS